MRRIPNLLLPAYAVGVCCLALAAAVFARPAPRAPAAAPPQATLKAKPPQSTLPVGSCGCGATGRCSCGAGCACPDCPASCDCLTNAAPPKAARADDFADKYARAVREGKTLLIWVGHVCPPCERAMPGYVHAHVRAYDGYSAAPEECVVVGVPDGAGGLTRVATLPPKPAPGDVEAALRPAPLFSPHAATAPPPAWQAMPFRGFGPAVRRGGGC